MARRSIIPLFVPHLGCPNDCVFCDQKRISGSPSPVCGADVTRALEAAKSRGQQRVELAFYGGSFTAVDRKTQRELLSAAAPYRADGTVQTIRLSTRPDAIDEDILEFLKFWGVQTVELGAQSMDERVLLASGRGHTAAETIHAAGLVKAAGLQLILQMMTGLPGSSRKSDVQTARDIIALRPDGVRIYPTVIVKDTALEAMWQAGLYQEHTVEAAVAVCADILPLFQEANIPVIRLGLNPTEELSHGSAVGGAYHPALGELARSEVLRRRAEALLQDVPAGAAVTLGVEPRALSAMIGQHRRNITSLCASLSLAALSVRPVEGIGDEIIIVDVRA
ncbi:MAG: radical SAM protein [Oscillospiraceae bacterium]|nr:radical SAM protein [Oscillospiraceae bacterium]